MSIKIISTWTFNIKSKILFVLISLFVLIFTGCSMIGLFIGSKTKNKKMEVIQVPGWEISEIARDKMVNVVLKNADTIQGVYRRDELMPLDEYSALYHEKTEKLKLDFKLPKPGDTIVIKINQGNNFNQNLNSEAFTFFGFDHNSIFIKGNNNIPQRYLYSHVYAPEINFGKINTLIKSGEIPIRTMLVLETTKEIKKINPYDIQYVSFIPSAKNKAMTGFLIGLGLDVITIGILAKTYLPKSGSSLVWNSNNNAQFGSCPYIYSYDGKNYRLDSETFGGAIFKAAQRTDVDNLDYLKEDQGYYKLRLTNELDETQYIDEFKLLVADHPEGTKVMPSFDGKLHVLNTLQSPSSAIDKDGNNVMHLIKSRDDKLWISNPFNRNPNVSGDGRDAMEITFNKPQNAETVKLAFNVQNTLWAASLQRDMLALHGNRLQDWYQLMNTSAPSRKAFIDAMIREGMLLVQVWDGHQWQTRDYVWEVGPFIPKDQVVVLDLKGIESEQLKIRLESTAGFWMINSIGADFTQEIAADIRELAPESAIDHTGKNVKEILDNNDGIYHVMPTTKDKVEITFKTIPENKNIARTYLLKCSGYYRIHTDETGEPKHSLLNTLISEPGAYGQFVLRKLNNNLVNRLKLIELK